MSQQEPMNDQRLEQLELMWNKVGRPTAKPEQMMKFLLLKGSRQNDFYIWDEKLGTYIFWDAKDDLEGALNSFCPKIFYGLRSWYEESSQFGMSFKEISSRFMTRMKKFEMQMQDYGCHLDMETRVATISVLAPQRFKAVKHDDVAQWFEALAGPAQLNYLLDWLAGSVDLRKPICAIYIAGAPDIGKNLLAAGLSSMFGGFANWKEVALNFQSMMGSTPMIWANEKMEKPKFADLLDVLRDLIGTDQISLEEKNRQVYNLRTNYRLVITANNERLVKALGSYNADDLDAVKQRIGYIECQVDARAKLRELADNQGLTLNELTASFAKHKIAEHVLWLSKNRVIPNSGNQRFIVRGWRNQVTDSLEFKSSNMRALSQLIYRLLRTQGARGVIRRNGEVWVNVGYCQEEWDLYMPKTIAKGVDWLKMSDMVQMLQAEKKRMRPPAPENVATRNLAAVNYYRLKPETLRMILTCNGFDEEEAQAIINDVVLDEDEATTNTEQPKIIAPEAPVTVVETMVRQEPVKTMNEMSIVELELHVASLREIHANETSFKGKVIAKSRLDLASETLASRIRQAKMEQVTG